MAGSSPDAGGAPEVKARRAIHAALVTGAWVLAGAGSATRLARRLHGSPPGPAVLAATIFSLGLLLVPVTLLSYDEAVTRLRRMVDARPMTTLVVAGLPILPYLLYWKVAAGSGWRSLAGVLLYVGPISLLALAGRRDGSIGWADVAVGLLVWLPLELRWLDPSFPWPPGGSGKILAGLLGLNLILILLLVVRRWDGMGYSIRLGRTDLLAGVLAWALFSVVGIPIARATGFVGPLHPPSGVLAVPLALVSIFLFTGLQEEVLFRGVFQGLLERSTRRPLPSLLAASILFGLAHLNNGPSPDWRYALMATLAGLAYGGAYRKTRRIAAAAVAHTLVDATWVLLFK